MISFDVVSTAVRESVWGARPHHDRVYLVAEIEITNGSDTALHVVRIPAAFVAEDGTRIDEQVDPVGWLAGGVKVPAAAVEPARVAFEIPRDLAAGGTVMIYDADGSIAHLAS